MSKKIIVLLFASIVIATGIIYYYNSYSQFRPLVFENDNYKEIEVDSSFYQRLKTVLDYYNEQYKTTSLGKVTVKRKIYNDKELVWNYTTKALDTLWVKNHKVLK